VSEQFFDVIVSVPGQSDTSPVVVVDEQRTRFRPGMGNCRDTSDVTAVTEDDEWERGDERVLDGMESTLKRTGHRLHQPFEPGWVSHV
jgi:hypothetical protein